MDEFMFTADFRERPIYASDTVYVNDFNDDRVHEEDILDYLVERCDFRKVEASELC